MKYIPLTQGKFAIVDDEDFKKLIKIKWQYDRYAVHNSTKNRKASKIYMHQIINKTSKGFWTDHINGDKLDNRKYNLRTVNFSQSNMNRIMKNKSGYKCVYRIRSMKASNSKKWYTRIKSNNKIIHLGSYRTKKLAAQVYNQKAQELFGEYARLNEIC